LTLTFDKESQDRLNDLEVVGQFRKYMDNIKHQFPAMYYVAVAEYHKEGGLHFHLIVGGVSGKELGLKYWKNKKRKGGNGYQRIYNVTTFKYGYTTAPKVDDSNACGHYIMKYITKNMGDVEVLKNNYSASKNLQTPETSIINNFFYMKANDFYKMKLSDFVDIEQDITIQLLYARPDYICFKSVGDSIEKRARVEARRQNEIFQAEEDKELRRARIRSNSAERLFRSELHEKGGFTDAGLLWLRRNSDRNQLVKDIERDLRVK
jgi:hypothetical protein